MWATTADGAMRDRAADIPISDAEAAALFADLGDAPALILAVSGGPDSTALLWLAVRWRARRKRGPALIAVTVDHGLRPESAREAAAVKRLARRFGLPHRTLRWTGTKPATGLQEAARAARYRLIASVARGSHSRHVLTAHSRDDQAETVLFRLIRGSGLAGLRGMTRLSPLPGSGEGAITLARPLLGVPKSRLLATLAKAGIPFADDPSNRDPRFTRPRLREIMPVLAAEGLDSRRFATFARRIARADSALECAADEAVAGLSPGPWPRTGPIALGANAYSKLSPEVGLRLLGRAVAHVGNEGPVELGKLEALHQALAAALTQAVRIRRTLAGALVTLSGGRLTVERAPPRRFGAKTGASGRKSAFTNPSAG
jgi:tRNA(Ile)-lysidine synthase